MAPRRAGVAPPVPHRDRHPDAQDSYCSGCERGHVGRAVIEDGGDGSAGASTARGPPGGSVTGRDRRAARQELRHGALHGQHPGRGRVRAPGLLRSLSAGHAAAVGALGALRQPAAGTPDLAARGPRARRGPLRGRHRAVPPHPAAGLPRPAHRLRRREHLRRPRPPGPRPHPGPRHPHPPGAGARPGPDEGAPRRVAGLPRGGVQRAAQRAHPEHDHVPGPVRPRARGRRGAGAGRPTTASSRPASGRSPRR